MTTTRITQRDLDTLLRSADAVSTLETNCGEYSAIVWLDNKIFDVLLLKHLVDPSFDYRAPLIGPTFQLVTEYGVKITYDPSTRTLFSASSFIVVGPSSAKAPSVSVKPWDGPHRGFTVTLWVYGTPLICALTDTVKEAMILSQEVGEWLRVLHNGGGFSDPRGFPESESAPDSSSVAASSNSVRCSYCNCPSGDTSQACCCAKAVAKIKNSDITKCDCACASEVLLRRKLSM